MHYLLRHIKCSGRIILLFNHCFVFPLSFMNSHHRLLRGT
nr:MAG TPA: hypothetical protein [Caudoviricetes sp.]